MSYFRNHWDTTLFVYQPLSDIRESIVSPLLCSDFKIEDAQKTFAAFNNLSLNAQSSDPRQIIYSQIGQFLLMCSVWPFSVPEPVTLPTTLTLMWMTSDCDLNLPTELTTFAWEQAPNSTLVIRHGDDHTSILATPGPATRVQGVAMDFLRTGVMPLASSDEQVTVISSGGTRGPVPGAYDEPTGAVAGDSSSVEDVLASGLSLGNAALRLRFAPPSYLATCIALAACCLM
ncbi:hypothetical protein B0H10DRAFT_2214398 [Mycena sp. CBHHK59/15]|nr:hypothetical protein B0H10DRAFT_2214398 [Mycena sp. CBHHK59/15]